MRFFKGLLFILGLLVIPTLALAEEKANPTTMDKVVDYATGKLDQVLEAAKVAIPQATDIAVQLAWVDAFQHLMYGIASIIASILTVLFVWKFFSLFMKEIKKDYHEACDPLVAVYFVSMIAGGVGSIAFLISGLIKLLNIWVWMGLYSPQLYLIHQVIDKVVK